VSTHSPRGGLPPGWQQRVLDLLMDQLPMGIAVYDRDLVLEQCSATWARMVEERCGLPPGSVRPGRHLLEILGGEEEAIRELLVQVLSGHTVQQRARPYAADGTTTYWDGVVAPVLDAGEVVGVVEVGVDVTGREAAYQRLEQRVGAFAAIAQSMTVDQPLAATLTSVVTTVRTAVGAVATSLLVWDDPADDAFRAYASAGMPDGYREGMAAVWRGARESLIREAASTQRMTRLSGARAMGVEDPSYGPLHRFWRDAQWEDVLLVPLKSQGRSVGTLNLYLRGGHEFDEDDRAFCEAVADQAAVAAQNARLVAAAEAHAALLERQRLARELHDSVSQALFSMTLHARGVQRHLTAEGVSGDSRAMTAVARLCDLAQGALAEMRALIFELRPGALAEDGLVAALHRQAAALTAREGLPITVTGPLERPSVDPQVEEHVYRMVLEALHNTLKHARATRATVTATVDDDRRELVVCVADDGVGFDPGADAPGHLGQRTMRDRASSIGGELSVDTSPGAGCRVVLRAPLAQR
jgi:signal transduction histidine kinase